MTFSALLLAGGESRRMGRDKALLEIGGQPLWRRQLDLLRGLNPEKIFVSARSCPAWLPDDGELLLDDRPSRGPLSGLAKALRAMRTTHLFALAVDMPRMTMDELEQLRRLAVEGCSVIPVIRQRPEPLAALYSAEAAVESQTALAGNDYSLQSIVDSLAAAGKVQRVPVPAERARLYRSVNTPRDLAEFDA